MARSLAHTETLTVRLEPEVKAVLTEKARTEAKPVGEVLRDLIRAFAEQERHLKFLEEARRQSLECARSASDKSSDDQLQYFQEEWK